MSRFQKIPEFSGSQKYGKKRRIRESGKLGNLLCITDPRNQDLRFNEKPPKRQQWGKLAFRETYNLFVPKKHSLLLSKDMILENKLEYNLLIYVNNVIITISPVLKKTKRLICPLNLICQMFMKYL